jgi:hypothetical protein
MDKVVVASRPPRQPVASSLSEVGAVTLGFEAAEFK